jgi:hypothetical protein
MKRWQLTSAILLLLLLAAGCNRGATQAPVVEPLQTYYKVDPATAGTITGTLAFTGKKPAITPIDMTSDPACVEAHKGKPVDQSLVVNPNGTLSNVFIYIKGGLEGKTFPPPAKAATIDQKGCWFQPRILGLQTGQAYEVVNSDPVTHNIHPLAHVNREWNHSQGPGDPPLPRKFVSPEIMIKVKCNIHGWMRAYIGVVNHPYFAVSGASGTFELPNLPPGEYTIEAWHETLGTLQQHVTVAPSAKIDVDFTFHGE